MSAALHSSDADVRWSAVLRRTFSSGAARIAVVTLTILVLACVFGPLVSPYAFDEQNIEMYRQAPSLQHWFGTDELGRDMLTRVLNGGRVSLAVGVCGTAVSILIGVVYGAISGYRGGRTDAVMMRIVDTLYALPFTIFVIVLTVAFGRNFLLIFVAIGAVEWLTMARIVRGQVLATRNQDFVRAGEVLGFSHARILFGHVLPNIAGPIVVYATLTVPQVILLESFISFLGLGLQPPDASWGFLINKGAKAMESYSWLLIFPGLALSLTLLSMNLLGDALRDAMDPRKSAG